MLFGLNVTYEMKPGMRSEFLAAVQEDGLLDAIRAEDGCLKYDYYLSVDHPDQLLLVEHWRDRASQQAHMTHPNMTKLAAIKARCALSTALAGFDL